MEENIINEIEQDLNIEVDNLGFELMDQPKRFMKWGRKYAEAIKEMGLAKRESSVTRSNINQDIRLRPEAYGLAKVTEAAIASTLESVEDVDKAEKNMIGHQFSVNIFSAAKEAFDQRKSMLEKVVQLYIDGYWSQPRIPSESVKKIADEGTAALKAQLKQRITKE
jgi:hypothetical protein